MLSTFQEFMSLVALLMFPVKNYIVEKFEAALCLEVPQVLLLSQNYFLKPLRSVENQIFFNVGKHTVKFL